MALNLMGKKQGMAQLFDEDGRAVPCTVILCEPNVITQLKTPENDGYSAIQSAHGVVGGSDSRTQVRRAGKPRAGIYEKAGVAPRYHMMESKGENLENYSLGQEIGVGIFNDVEYVDVVGVSKGKGYQGVMKVHGFSGGPASHGCKKYHRGGGSTGMCSSPGRVFPGTRKAKRLGGKRVTVQSLKIVDVNEEENYVVVKGAVPGPVGSQVHLQEAMKKKAKKS
ncbi:MAG: 50S ribosomal protein L3 [Chlamydiota bacterium]